MTNVDKLLDDFRKLLFKTLFILMLRFINVYILPVKVKLHLASYKYSLFHLLLPFTPFTESRIGLLLRKNILAEKGPRFFDFAPPYENP